jgi:hypothetical protein
MGNALDLLRELTSPKIPGIKPIVIADIYLLVLLQEYHELVLESSELERWFRFISSSARREAILPRILPTSFDRIY